MSSLDPAALKKGGFIAQKQPDRYAVRLRVPLGLLTSEQLGYLQRIAEWYGEGKVHLTTRQGVEIPGVHVDHLESVRQELAAVGLAPGSCGPRVRNILSCPGTESCGHGIGDARMLAASLDEAFVGKDFPVKIKIAVSGCPNSCSTPQVNDVGFVGALEPCFDEGLCTRCELCVEVCREGAIRMAEGRLVWDREACIFCGECVASCPTGGCGESRRGYLAYVGGKVGRHPQLGVRFGEFWEDREAMSLVEAVLEFVGRFGGKGERLGSVLNRTGPKAFEAFVRDAVGAMNDRETSLSLSGGR